MDSPKDIWHFARPLLAKQYSLVGHQYPIKSITCALGSAEIY